jgi:hypothetical protein
MASYQLAQVNIGRVKAPVEDPLMAGFVSRLDEINALADRSPGFVWRLQTSVGNATYFRPYPDDDRILINMSVWESIGALRHYVYKTAHAELLRQRESWFEKFPAPILHSGGCPRAIVLGWTKRRNGWLISSSMGRRSSLSPSKRLLSRMNNFSDPSIGRRSCPVRRPRLKRARQSAASIATPDRMPP